MTALVATLRRRLMVTWLWQALFVLAIRRNPDHQLVHLTDSDGTDALCRDGFTGHLLSSQFGEL